MAKSALDVLSKDQVRALRQAGFVVIHREPTEAMISAYYAKNWPECVDPVAGYHRMVATSIKQQNQTSS